MQVSVKSDVGQRRSVNEDAAGYFYNQNQVPLVIVCDGIGGHNAGDVASAMALADLGHAWNDSHVSDIEEVYQWFTKHIQETNDRIFQRSTQEEGLNGMGTTLVMAALVSGELLIANVGDSRAYLYRQQTLRQVTEDQSLVNALVKSGEITKDEAQHHPSRHIVTQSIGITLNVEIDFVRLEMREGDLLLLCSDGLSDMLDEEGIRAILASEAIPDEKATQLIEAANRAGGRDNITVAVAQVTADWEGVLC